MVGRVFRRKYLQPQPLMTAPLLLMQISASLQEEGEVHEALSKDVSVTSVDSVADDMWYVAFGADYNSASLDQDIYMDYDLIANEILDKKRIEGV